MYKHGVTLWQLNLITFKNCISSIIGKVNEPVFFLKKHILDLEHIKQ